MISSFPITKMKGPSLSAPMAAIFARYWVHNGFVTVESQKMSKSLGNFLTIRDALKTYHPEVLRLFSYFQAVQKPP